MGKAYQEFISQRCAEIIAENSGLRPLYEEISQTIQKVKKTFTQEDYALFCEYESQINNARVAEHETIYREAREDT